MTTECKFEGSILMNELRNANNKTIFNLIKYVSMAFNRNVDSKFWIEAYSYMINTNAYKKIK